MAILRMQCPARARDILIVDTKAAPKSKGAAKDVADLGERQQRPEEHVVRAGHISDVVLEERKRPGFLYVGELCARLDIERNARLRVGPGLQADLAWSNEGRAVHAVA